MTQMNLFADKEFVERQHKLIERDNIEILDVGPWGIQWRSEDIPLPNSMFKGDHIAQFGFSCAGCGASVVNQEELIHKSNCDSKSPYHKKEN